MLSVAISTRRVQSESLRSLTDCVGLPARVAAASLGGAKVHGVGVTVALRMVHPRVHSQMALVAQDARGCHLMELPQLETLSQVMQVALVVYRTPRFPIAILPPTGHRLA